MSSSVVQLPLGIRINENNTFENFYPGNNALLLDTLRQGNEHYIYLWGDRYTGKSHLLQAVCHAEHLNGLHPVYLPLSKSAEFSPQILEGLEQSKIVVLDDIEMVVAQPEWEEALFALYNAIKESSGRLVVASRLPPVSLKLELADLVSRLSWGPVFQVEPLEDSEKTAALQMRAQQRGLQLEHGVAEFMIKRSPRDMRSLFDLLDKLDEASMVEKRRLTIPFVKTYIQQLK